MSKNKNRKKAEDTNMEPTSIIEEIIIPEETDTEVEMTEATPAIEEMIVEEPKANLSMSNNVKDTDPDAVVLYELIEDYLNSILNNVGINRTEDNLIKFIKIAKHIARKDKVKLIKIFFLEIVQGNFKHLMAQELVFQHINKVNDIDKIKIETMYTALMTLEEHLKRPKRFGFPLDLDKVRQGFGGESLATFIKSYLN